MKKFAYITLFTLLGIITSFLIHGVLELGIVALLEYDFARFNLGLSWDGWFAVHRYGGIFLLVLGVVVGLREGFHWWPIIYPEDENGNVSTES